MAKVKGAIYLKGFSARIERAARQDASTAAAEHILGVSQDLVPIEEGVLAASGRVTTSDGGLQASVSYDTVYAKIQHDALDFKHKPGRQALYLAQPMQTEREACLKIMAAVMRRSVR